MGEAGTTLSTCALDLLLRTLGVSYEVGAEPLGPCENGIALTYGKGEAGVSWGPHVQFPGCDAPADEGETDVIRTVAFLLAGGDEAQVARDPMDRVSGSALEQCGYDPSYPTIARAVSILWDALVRAARTAGLQPVRIAPWPSGYEFAVLLSHDVDLWRKRTFRQFLKELLRSVRSPGRLAQVWRAFRRGPDPWSDLGGIADLEAARGLRSTFFLLAGRPNEVVDGVHVVNGYQAAPGAVADAARALAARGWEIGLHGSFDSYQDAAALAAERRDVEALSGQPVTSCRQHFLRLRRPQTWQAQVEAGLTIDATLGYHDRAGYRAGMSFPYHPFDGVGLLPIIELPLTVMDGALCERQGLDAEAAWREMEGYLECARADGTMLGLLWHNTYFCDLDAPGYRSVYERVLDWTAERNGWGASARDIAEWWRLRDQAELTTHREGGKTVVDVALPEGLDRLAVDLPDVSPAQVEFVGGAGNVGEGGLWALAPDDGTRITLILDPQN
jgi:peptidoglycan/xylan/chitin deacetylase (PgdA/CDA1 family)